MIVSDITDTFSTDGAQAFRGAVAACLPELENALAGLSPDQAGTRLHGIMALSPLLAADGPE